MLVISLTGVGSAVQQPSGQITPDRANTSGIQQPAGNTPKQVIRIDIRPNGSGIVTVRYRIPLTGANETAAFERLRMNITENPTRYRTRFGARMARVVTSAQATTGRQMRVANRTVNATRRGSIGTVTYTFLWTQFAATDGNQLQVGDALAGQFLENGTRLIIAWPTRYEPTTVRPSPDNRTSETVQWTPPTQFGKNEPFVKLAPAGSGANTQNTDSTLKVALGIIVVGALGIMGWLIRRHHDERNRPSSDEMAAVSTDAKNDSRPPESTAGNDPQTETETETELLSNEERVIQVLEHAGGRAKQQRVVEELDWTEAKTSQVVSGLREKGTIEGFRLGRENVLTLPEEENTKDDEESPE